MEKSKGHFLEGKKIIIAGAGIAGLSFFVAIRKQWNPSLNPPQIIVYDRDTKKDSVERDGYSLSLNGLDENGGLIACRDLGLLDQMLESSVAGLDKSATFRVWSSEWTELLSVKSKPHDGLPTAAMRIRRRGLRNVLVEAGEGAGQINWNTTCTSAERLQNGRVRVTLSCPTPDRPEKADDMRTDECDLLIVADGANSKIRASLRPNDTLEDQGIVQIGGVARFPDGIPPPVNHNWGMAISGRGVGCFCSPVDTTGVLWGVSCRDTQPRPKHDRNSDEEFEALKKEALEIGHMLAEPFPTMVNATEKASTFTRSTHDKKPFEHDKSLRGIVFIGDSNHAVSPFAGNGANLALKDGWDLATQLCKNETLDMAVAAYDKLALPRAIKTLKFSHSSIDMTHKEGIKYWMLRAMLWAANWVV